MDSLIHYHWHIDEKLYYFLFCVILSIPIRVVLAVISAAQLSYVDQMGFWKSFWGALVGFIFVEDKKFRARSDFTLPFWLGFLELLAYPVLIATGALSVIGAWIAFKALAQWRTWTTHRFTFNRFLLGNALVVFASYWLSYEFVSVQ
jgi:hypothetical protein